MKNTNSQKPSVGIHPFGKGSQRLSTSNLRKVAERSNLVKVGFDKSRITLTRFSCLKISNLNFSHLTIFLLLLSISFLSLKCKDDVLPPTPPDNKTKDPRTYTWTIDTLSYPGSMQTTMRDIWASSPTDVHVVGHNDQNRGLMYHYDGKSWSDVKLAVSQGGQIIGALDFSAIYGFGPNDVYAVGERIYTNPNPPPNFLSTSLVIHFNGAIWNEVSPSDSNLIQCIWGSVGNIWCGGYSGIIYNYSDGLWKYDSLKIMRGSQWFSAINSISGSTNDKKYLLAYSQQNGSFDQTFYFATGQSSCWCVVDSFVFGPTNPINKWGITKIWVSPTNRVFSLGPDLYELNGTTWSVLKHLDYSFLQGIYAVSDNNLLICGTYGTLLHFNGNDWFSFDQFRTMDVHFKAIWADEKEIFVIGYTTGGNKTIVLHGK